MKTMGALCALIVAMFQGLAAAQSWPTRPLRFVVPFPPGGGNDIVARLVGERVGQVLQQPVVIENKPGAGGNIGAAEVAKAAADGYTYLVAAHAIFVINPHLYAKLPFDPAKDFEPVGLFGNLPVVLVVHPDVGATTVRQLIDLAKSKPGSLSYASAGTGTPHHLAAELFKSMAGVDLVHVPYKGGAPAAQDLLAGRVQVMFAPINNVISQVKAGKLRTLAVATEQPLSQLPGVPTVAQAALAGYQVDNWIGLAAPAGTPKTITSALSDSLRRVLDETETRQKLAAQGIEAMSATPEEMTRMIRADSVRWGGVIRNAGIKAD